MGRIIFPQTENDEEGTGSRECRQGWAGECMFQ